MGTLTLHEGLLALRLPGVPGLVVLAGGARFADLQASGLPTGTRVRAEGEMHPSHADEPPGMRVERWTELEPADERSADPG